MLLQFDETMGRDNKLARKTMVLSASIPPTLTVSRHSNFPKKCLICFSSWKEPPYSTISSTFTGHVHKQDITLLFFFFIFLLCLLLGVQAHASPHLSVTLCTRPLKTKVCRFGQRLSKSGITCQHFFLLLWIDKSRRFLNTGIDLQQKWNAYNIQGERPIHGG